MANRMYQFEMAELAQYQSETLIFHLFTSMKHAIWENDLESHTCASYAQFSAIWNTCKTILRLRIKYDFGMRMMHIVRMEIILRLIISLTAQAHLVMLSLLHSTGNCNELPFRFFRLSSALYAICVDVYAVLYTSHFHILWANIMVISGECVDCII